MRMKFSELNPGKCFRQGKKIKKKLDDERVVTVSSAGRIRTSTQKGDPDIEPLGSCPLRLIGTGLRKHPEMLIQIGAGRPREIRDEKLRRS